MKQKFNNGFSIYILSYFVLTSNFLEDKFYFFYNY